MIVAAFHRSQSTAFLFCFNDRSLIKYSPCRVISDGINWQLQIIRSQRKLPMGEIGFETFLLQTVRQLKQKKMCHNLF
jgi:hypothetical protein